MAGSLEVLTAFVVLPAAIGAACRYLLEAVRPERTAAVLTLVRSTSIVSLLALNYANAAVALPRLALRGLAADALTVAVLSVALCAAVFGIALLVSRGGRGAHSDTGRSFVYITGMKNTGAALVLAASALGVHPLAALAPVFYTLAQHLAAALTDRLLCRGPASTIGTSMPKDAWTAEEDAVDEIDSRLDTGLRSIFVAAQTDA
jgi:ACR3 family arsenite efflux pump ArsB